MGTRQYKKGPNKDKGRVTPAAVLRYYHGVDSARELVGDESANRKEQRVH